MAGTNMNEITSFAAATQAKSPLPSNEINQAAMDFDFFKSQFPEGKLRGSEFCLGDISGEAGESLRFNMIEGWWQDFSAHQGEKLKGRYPISFFARHWGCSQWEATERLAAMLGIKKIESTLILPVPPEEEELVLPVRGHVNLETMYQYRDMDGSLLGYRVRYARGRGKSIVPFTYRLGKGWDSQGWELLQPIFGMELLGADAEKRKKVLIVEGEKTALKARELKEFEGWIVITWSGGTKSVSKVWWEPLRGREVVIWPDNDMIGRQAANEVAFSAHAVGASRVKIVEVPDRLPKAWDLADLKESDLIDVAALVRDAREHDSVEDMAKNRFVWCIGMKRFYDTVTWSGIPLDKESVDAALAHQIDKASKWLLSSPDLPKVQNPTYWPGKGRFVTEKDGAMYFNTWRDSGIEACDWSESEVAMFLSHTAYVIPDEEFRHHFLNWLAHNVQYPGTKMNWAVLLQGKQGTGKSYFFALMREVLGENCGVATTEDLSSGYTGWASGKCFVGVEEILDLGRKEISNKLKTMITDAQLRIHEKFQAAYMIPNRVNFLLLTNYENALVLDEDDRRYAVYFSPAEPMGREYYSALFGDLARNAAAIKGWLLDRDISAWKEEWALGRAPVTEAKREMVGASMSVLESKLHSMIEAGIPPLHTELVTIQELEGWLAGSGYSGKASPHAIGAALKKLGWVKMRSASGKSDYVIDLEGIPKARIWCRADVLDLWMERTPNDIRELFRSKEKAM